MSNPHISVIIPVYNLVQYLGKCLDTVCNQTLKDIEIIAVYDPSQDNSLEILQGYENNDSRIKIITKDKKEGLSIARNRGIEIATGEYIGFIDGDDYIEYTMYEKLYEKAKKTGAELVFCAISTVNAETEEKLDVPHYNYIPIDRKYDDIGFNWREIKENLCSVPVVAWNKIYKRELIEKYEIKFPEHLTYEDHPFFFRFSTLANKIAMVREQLYYYRQARKGSLVAARGRAYLDVFKSMSICEEGFKLNGVYEEIKEYFNIYYSHYLIWPFYSVHPEYRKEYFKNAVPVLRNFDLNKYRDKDIFYDLFYEEGKALQRYPYYWQYVLSKLFRIKKYRKRIEFRFLNHIFTLHHTNTIIFSNPSLSKEQITELLERINFQKYLDRLIKKYNKKRVVIYGSGLVYSVISQNYDLSGLNIVGIADRKFKEDHESIDGYRALSFKGLRKLKPDVVIIAALATEHIKDNIADNIFKGQRCPELTEFIKNDFKDAIDAFMEF